MPVKNWKFLRKSVDIPFFLIGLLLTVYIAVSAFGYIKNSSEHYSNFIMGICMMAGLLALRNLCDEKLSDDGNSTISETGEAAGPKKFFWARFVFALLSLVTSTVAMGYIRYNAVYLEQNQPFFNDTDLVFGWLMTISILCLTLIHWGLLLTSVISIAIAYFFFGYLIENPLFSTPEYDHAFIRK